MIDDWMAMLGVVGAICGIIALIVAARAQQRADAAHGALESLRRRLERMDQPTAPPHTGSPSQRTTRAQPSPPPAPPAQPRAHVMPTSPPPAPRAVPAHLTTSRPAPPPADAPTPPRPTGGSLEERLGTKVFIWIGGVALVLAGAYLVQYSFSRDLLSEPVRLALAAAFGIALLGAGEFMRTRSSRIAQALSGAAVADLFGCLLAGTNLYHLIDPRLALPLMAVVAALAVVLSLRQGPFVALLGLVGGFITPALVGTTDPAAGPLFGYLLLLEAGLVAVARHRRWFGLMTLALIAGLLWAVIYTVLGLEPGDRFWVSGFMLATAVVYILSAAGRPDKPDKPLTRWGLAMGAASAAAGLLGVLAGYGGFTLMDFGLLALLGAAALVLARLDGRYLALPWIAAAATALTLIAWWTSESLNFDTPEAARFALVTAGLGAMYILGGYGCLWRSPRADIWASLSAVATVAYLLIARVGMIDVPAPAWFAWWMPAAALAVLLAALAATVWARRTMPRGEGALSALSLGALAAAALAMPMGLNFPGWAVAWVALAAATAWIFERLRIAGLPAAAAALAVLGLAPLIVPGPLLIDVGQRLIFNQLLAVYGPATAALALATWALRRSSLPRFADAAQLLALLMGLATAAVLIRQAFHGSDIDAFDITLLEWATYSVAGLAAAHAMLIATRRWSHWTLLTAAAVAAWAGLLSMVAGPCLFDNPLIERAAVGAAPIFNALLYVYALPAVLLGTLAYLMLRTPTIDSVVAANAAKAAGIAAVVLTFVLVSLQVRQAYAGSILLVRETPISQAEWYSYSVAWVVLAAALLALAIRLHNRPLRYASLVVMLLTVGKVFAFDTARLDDLYRVLSFVGLGLSLLGLGYVYQRFVFQRREPS